MRKLPAEKPRINAVDIEQMSMEQQGFKLIKTIDSFQVQINELQKRKEQYQLKLKKVENDLEKIGRPASWTREKVKNT